MPLSTRHNLLCSYRYNALDRSISWTPIGRASIERFHCKDRLATEIQGPVRRSIFQHDDHVLAQRQHMDEKVDITLLATDLQMTVLNTFNADRHYSIAYTPYGHRQPSNGLISLLAFNGERPDPVTGHYHLGSGYRQFNPVSMRFNSPDSFSPFEKGGLNAYVYCGANPVLNTDPTGRSVEFFLLRVNDIMRSRVKNSQLSAAFVDVVKAMDTPLFDFPFSLKEVPGMAGSIAFDNRVLPADEYKLATYTSATGRNALEIFPEANNQLINIRKRTAIINDASILSRSEQTSALATQMNKHHAELQSSFLSLETRKNEAYKHLTDISMLSNADNQAWRIPRPSLVKNMKNLRQPESK